MVPVEPGYWFHLLLLQLSLLRLGIRALSVCDSREYGEIAAAYSVRIRWQQRPTRDLINKCQPHSDWLIRIPAKATRPNVRPSSKASEKISMWLGLYLQCRLRWYVARRRTL